MDQEGSVTRMILDLRNGDPVVRNAAARLIWERYFRDLLKLARKNLDKRIRLRTDEEDVTQSMFKSFCLRWGARRVLTLTGRDELWRLLVTITIRKARNAAKARAARGKARHRPRANLVSGGDEDGFGRLAIGATSGSRRPFAPGSRRAQRGGSKARLQVLANPRAASDRPLAVGRTLGTTRRNRRPPRLHRAWGGAHAGADSQPAGHRTTTVMSDGRSAS